MESVCQKVQGSKVQGLTHNEPTIILLQYQYIECAYQWSKPKRVTGCI